MRLKGKQAVITGAGSGIGRATSLVFAREGASLIIADRDQAGLDETLRLLKEQGQTAIGISMDAGKEADVQALVARAEKEFGGLDIFYANAGISGGLCRSLNKQ